MPCYKCTLTVPSGTPADTPVKAEINVEKGIVTRVEVRFPAGCVQMVYVGIYYGIKRLWPEPEEEWFSENDYCISFREYWVPPEYPCTLTVLGFAPLTTYNHTITVRIFTLPRFIAAPMLIMSEVAAYFRRLLGLE